MRIIKLSLNYSYINWDNLKDLCSAIRKMGNFLGKRMTNEQVECLADHLDIRNFRNNPAVNYDLVKEAGLMNSGEPAFIRKGLRIY